MIVADRCGSKDYNVRVNELWQAWIKSFGNGMDNQVAQHMDALAAELAEAPMEVAKWAVRWQLRPLGNFTRLTS